MAKNITPEKLFRLYKSQIKFWNSIILTLPEKKWLLISLHVGFNVFHNADEG